MKEAAYYEALNDGKVRCHLCPYDCILSKGRIGACRVRKNKDGKLVSLNYNRVASVAIDPMEKKPLYHYYPGQAILSLGTTGCNFKCSFCQNHEISQTGDDQIGQPMTAQEAVALAQKQGARFMAYTYNEPLIWYEFVLETAQAAREVGIRNVLVTNGFIHAEPLRELLPYIDAMNVDIKSMSEAFYQTVCKGRLEPVLQTARMARAACHLEITDLLIPNQNDQESDWTAMAGWIADELGRSTPVHLSAYTPRYRMKEPATPPALLERAYAVFAERLDHVYLGNVVGPTGRDTCCIGCGETLIRRDGYTVGIAAMADDGRCNRCGADNHIVNGN